MYIARLLKISQKRKKNRLVRFTTTTFQKILIKAAAVPRAISK